MLEIRHVSDPEDLLDPSTPDVLVTPLELFARWERQQWKLADLDFAADRAFWFSLRPLVRRELRAGMDSFLFGERAVTETLGPLVDGAPSLPAQAFLATQLVDEARHTLFFLRYMSEVDGAEVGSRTNSPESLAALLDQELRRATSAVRESPQDRDAWYRSIVIYHLLIEGVLAISGLRSLRQALHELPDLKTLSSGLTNVARDESRHIGFGVSALRVGVADGHTEAIWRAFCDFTPVAVRALVGPERSFPRLVSDDIQYAFGEQRQRLWGLAKAALLGRVDRIGFGEAQVGELADAWSAARESALDEYERLHGGEHPARMAAGRKAEGADEVMGR